MSRNLMPKSGAMAPYIVVNRDAAVAGVFSVDGEAGAIVLSTKYLQIANYNTDKAEIEEAIGANTTAIASHTTAIQANTEGLALKAAKGANSDITELNGLTKAITIEDGGTGASTPADARTNLQLGSVATENTVPLDKGGTGSTTAEGARTALGLGSVSTEDIVPVNKGGTGVSSQEAIWDVVKPTGATRLSANGVDPLDAATVGQLPSGGGYIGQYWHHPSRTHFEGGTIPGDGQVIAGASILYPELVEKVVAGELPNTTETTWQANKEVRASYVYDADADTLRVPDYNGVQEGSIPASVFRGDGGGLAVGSMQESAVPNIAGSANMLVRDNGATDPVPTGPFSWKSTANGNVVGTSGVARAGLVFDPSTISDVYKNDVTEARMNSIVGCIVIRVATDVTNDGNVDMLELQAQVEVLRAETQAMNDSIGYALIDSTTAGTVAVSQRKVLVNPFGINTPVVCMIELQMNGVWQAPGWVFNPSVGAFGVSAFAKEGEGIVVQAGSYRLSALPVSGGGSGGASGSQDLTTGVPCRVHVWSIGTNISKLKQISQIDPALIAEFKAPPTPVGVREIWAKSTESTGLTGSQMNFPVSILGKTLYICLATNPNYVITHQVPGGAPPLATNATSAAVSGVPAGWFRCLISLTAFDYRFAVSPDGMSAVIASMSGTGGVGMLSIHIDDYSVQP